jgi:hypothetical protein
LLEGFVNPALGDNNYQHWEVAQSTKPLQQQGNISIAVTSASSSLASPSLLSLTPHSTEAPEASRKEPACQAGLRESVELLQAHGRWHALALLRAARNHLEEALEIWKGLTVGELKVRGMLSSHVLKYPGHENMFI